MIKTPFFARFLGVSLGQRRSRVGYSFPLTFDREKDIQLPLRHPGFLGQLGPLARGFLPLASAETPAAGQGNQQELHGNGN